SGGLLKLRPVTFRYKQDATNMRRYGLVAEEVERVYPELVTYDEQGKPLAVRYSVLDSMLLNELQKQDRELRRQRRDNRKQAAEFNRLSARVAADNRELREMLDQLGTLELAMRKRKAIGGLAALAAGGR